MSNGFPIRSRRRTALVAIPAALALLLAGCGGGDDTTASSSDASASAPSPSATEATVAAATAPQRKTPLGVTVTGDFGSKPALTVPTSEAPTKLETSVLVEGKGEKVKSGDYLVVNYFGQTWKPKDGKVNIFDNSYDRKRPTVFPIGVGQVIDGWDKSLVGQNIGSRVLISVPPAQGYGTDAGAHELGGQTLLFVVDIVGSLPKPAAATGEVVKAPAGYPVVENVSGKEPKVTSTKGVTAPQQDKGTLLIKGTGATIADKGNLALQIVQSALTDGTAIQNTWAQAPRIVPVADVLQVAPQLKGQKVGSRVMVLTADAGQGSSVLIVDVIAQFGE